MLARTWLEPRVGKDAELLIGVFLHGHSHHEVGQALGLSEAASAQRACRACRKIRHQLRGSLSDRDLVERV